MKKVTLPSGKVLEISLASFSEANALNKAVASELKGLKIDRDLDLEDPNFIKDAVCTAIASDKIMGCLDACIKRCTYDGIKIDKDTFEPEENRQDYFIVYKEVLIETIRPFLKSLLSQFGAQKPEMKGQ